MKLGAVILERQQVKKKTLLGLN